MNKRIIILLLIAIAIIVFTIISILVLINKRNENTIYGISKRELIEELSAVESKNSYYIVHGCINKYYTYCNLLSTKNSEEEGKAISKAIYNMLDEEYLEYNDITESNVLSKINVINNAIVYVDEMFVSERKNNIDIYYVNGVIREKDKDDYQEFRSIVKLDYSNRTFSIMPHYDISTHYTNKKEDANIHQIEKNENNQYLSKNVERQIYVRDLFNDFKDRCMYYIESIYSRLDEAYKEKFANVEELKEYIDNMYKDINSVQLEQYKREVNGDNDRYILIDTEGNYIILNETSIMNYTIILDTYTIDLPEFLEKYNNAKAQEKVILNLNKINLALNVGDYKYVYNKLADSYKINNFPTIESFETYVKTNLFDKNIFDYLSFGDEVNGKYYTYNVDITDETEKLKSTVNKTFIMQLRRRHRF